MSISNKGLNKLRGYRLSIKEWLSTIYMYRFCSLYGIQLGSGCRFWNKMILFKEVGSTIEFGNGCFFRSDRESNLIGVNRACIVSSHASNAVIKVGDNCGFSGTSIGIKESLTVGNNVQVGANTYITDFDWHSFDPSDRDNPKKIAASGIIIDDNVWLGLNCIVLKGVHIGANAIIGAGSVITKNIPANCIAAGNPCRVLKTLELPVVQISPETIESKEQGSAV